MTEETGKRELSDEARLLWGLREVPRRGPKSALSVRDITEAAIEVADADGLGAVSMARVAAQLGNSTMALYRHVRSKDELLLLMTDAGMDPPPASLEGDDWRAKLAHWARAVLDLVRRHPWYVHVPITGPPVGPGNLAWFDSALAALSGTGIEPGEKVGLVMGLTTYVQGAMRLSADLRAGYTDNPEGFDKAYGRTLAAVVDPRRFPALWEVIEAGVFGAGEDFAADQEEDFEFGLARYLDGIASYLDSRGCAEGVTVAFGREDR